MIAPIKNEAGEVCMYILNFEDTEAAAEPPNSADLASTVRFSKCNLFNSVSLVTSSASWNEAKAERVAGGRALNKQEITLSLSMATRSKINRAPRIDRAP